MQFEEVINSDLLLAWGGNLKHYEKDALIFLEDQHPRFYHQVVEGKIKMYSTTEEGKEFIQGFFSPGQSFGEPPLFTPGVYPASAIAVEPSIVIRLHVDSFKQLLKDNFDIHYKVTCMMAQRILNKANNLKEISCNNPAHRILSILKTYKKDRADAATNQRIRIDFTRQEIADMSGLRVETVIRTMRHLHDDNILVIEKGKVYY
ncbi:Crp/Fnr family transcriptional regulator [Aridibaculum aurantiacum]|uniref:Crp/Fnr family transcriptional regulator n=1 Tax=Aridibaculum aurantiacum TaxID=2810307 RepID=UPI001A97C43E|nr:Crp/Fnr family transcriptional regulator [Aridibaculum aurantiacum]